MIAMLSFSAFAGSITLRDLENGSDYESIEISYDVSHGAVIWIEARHKNGIPGHPETYVDTYMVSSQAISFVDGNFIVTINGESTVCAKLEGRHKID